VQATKIVSLLESYITKELFYCGGKYRRSTPVFRVRGQRSWSQHNGMYQQ